MPKQKPVVLITGCSSGFGLGLAIDLAHHGFSVVATMRDLERRAELDARAHESAVSLDVRSLDITSQDSISAGVEHVMRAHGRIDALVNNAGFSFGGCAYDMTMAEYRQVFETNFFGTVALTKAVLPMMIEQRAGRIIQVSSLNGRIALPSSSAYSASKFALEGFSEALRYELRPHGVWVSIIEPGGFKTDIGRNRGYARAGTDPSSPFLSMSQGLQAFYEAQYLRRPSPKPVIQTIRRVLTTPKPHLRYVVGKDARALLLIKRVSEARLESMILKKTAARKK